MSEIAHENQIGQKIYLVRGHKVILDQDLALIYGTKTKSINLAIKRNLERFPQDFCFQLTEIEWEILRFQIETSSSDYGGRRYMPYVFTEHGVVMLASILKSSIAIRASIEIARLFISLRNMVQEYSELERRISKMELKYDDQFKIVFSSIKQLLREVPILDPKKKKIGLLEDENLTPDT